MFKKPRISQCKWCFLMIISLGRLWARIGRQKQPSDMRLMAFRDEQAIIQMQEQTYFTL